MLVITQNNRNEIMEKR